MTTLWFQVSDTDSLPRIADGFFAMPEEVKKLLPDVRQFPRDAIVEARGLLGIPITPEA